MKNQISTFVAAIRYCLHLSWKTSHLYTIIRLLAFILMALLPYIPIYVVKYMIDSLAGFSVNKGISSAVLLSLLLLVLARICERLFKSVNDYVRIQHDELMEHDIDKSLIQKTSTMDITFFDSPDYLDTLQAVLMDSRFLPNIVWNLFNAFGSFVSMAIAVAAIVQYEWFYAIIIIIATFPSAIAAKRYAKVLYRWRLDHMEEERKRSYIQHIASDKQYASDIRLFGLSSHLIGRYRELWEYCYYNKKKLQKKKLIRLVLSEMLPEICLVFILYSIIQGIVLGRYTVGDLPLFIGLFTSLLLALNSVVQSISSVYEDNLRAETVQMFFSRPNTVSDCGKIELSGPLHVIFDKVSFRYPNSDAYVLRNISFSIKEDEKVCLIGVNGAGKSTIIKLLLRFYDATDGRILINGLDIQEYSLESLRHAFSTFFQDYKTYAFTFKENITLSDWEKKSGGNRFQQALHLSGAHEIVSKLANGYETFIHRIYDEGGYEPSGGEAQKMSLARTIYRNCSMIVFDEPSAALDPIAEANLFENMKEIWRGKSALFTSHRLAAVHIADKILMIEDGHIVESGTHRELIANNGKYKHLYTLQAQKYVS